MSIGLLTVLSAVIAMLVTALGYTIRANVKLQKEVSDAHSDAYYARNETNMLRTEAKELEKRLSFLDGLQAGRKTDTLYQQLLKKYTNSEQFTVMMNGTEEGDNG